MNSTLVTAAVALGSALLGGPVWSLVSTLVRQYFRTGEREIDRLREAHRACEDKIAALEDRLEAVEHHHASLMPRWITGAAKKIMWINGAAMVAIFGPLGRSREEVEGHTFADLFDSGVARELDRLDRAALARPGQAVSTMLQIHPQLPSMHIVKVAGIGRDNELIYEGYAYCINDPARALDRGERRQEEQRGLSFLRVDAAKNKDRPPA